MREHEHTSDHILSIDIDRRTNREEERVWWVAISSLDTYTDAEEILQQRVEPGVGRRGRGWVCSYDFIILKWEEWPR